MIQKLSHEALPSSVQDHLRVLPAVARPRVPEPALPVLPHRIRGRLTDVPLERYPQWKIWRQAAREAIEFTTGTCHLDVELIDGLPRLHLLSWLWHCRALPGIVYFPDAAELRAIACILRQVNRPHNALVGTTSEPPKARGGSNTPHLLLATSASRHAYWPGARFIVHSAPPATFGEYIHQISPTFTARHSVRCLLLHTKARATHHCAETATHRSCARANQQVSSIERYILTSRCRHLVVTGAVNSGVPGVPPAKRFNCHRCDNCMMEPRAMDGDDLADRDI